MNALAPAKSATLYPWKPRPGETPEELLQFLWWALCGGEVNTELAKRYAWTERRNALDAFDDLAGLSHEDKAHAIMFSLLDQAYIAARHQHIEALEVPERTAREWTKQDLISLFTRAANTEMPERTGGIDWSKAPREIRQAHLAVSKWVHQQIGA